MEQTVRGIVLRRWDSGESDRRLSVLTAEIGRITVVAKGSRKAKSRLAGPSEPLSISTMQLAQGRQFWFLTQAQAHSSFPGLRSDYVKLQLALGLVELYSHVSSAGSSGTDTFDLIVLSLAELAKSEEPVAASVWAQLKLLEHEGVAMSFSRCSETGKAVAENPAWFSPAQGGYVPDDLSRPVDRYLVRAEALLGLAKTAELNSPPSKLKYSKECFEALRPVWRSLLHVALPANESAWKAVQDTSN